MSQVIVVIGPGSIGQAIARRIGSGKHVVLADLRQENADRVAEVMRDAGFDITVTTIDVSSRDSVLALVEPPRRTARSRALSMRRASRPVKRQSLHAPWPRGRLSIR